MATVRTGRVLERHRDDETSETWVSGWQPDSEFKGTKELPGVAQPYNIYDMID